jgi:hypothetical protein
VTLTRRLVLQAAGAAAFLALRPARAALASVEGALTQGGFAIGTTAHGARVLFDGRRRRLDAEGRFLLGFSRDAPASMKLEVEAPGGSRETQRLSITERAWRTQRIDGLPPAMVTPGEADLKRIAEENQRIAAARAHDTAQTWWAAGFDWPVIGPISGVYGTHRVLNGEPRQPHFGVDIAAPEGTPIRAPADGIVRLAETDLYFTGGTAILDHGFGLSSTYLHMSEVAVQTGDRLARGERIGAVGATGRATGPHLCWRFNLFATRLDPELVAGSMPEAAP